MVTRHLPFEKAGFTKGSSFLLKNPTSCMTPDVADWLGVGRNMGKSIKHWLLATGLADQAEGHGRDMSLKVQCDSEARTRARPVFSAGRHLVGFTCGARELSGPCCHLVVVLQSIQLDAL